MPDWLLVTLGIAGGLVLIYGILWVCFRLESRPRSKRKSWFAEPSGSWDSNSFSGGNDSMR